MLVHAEPFPETSLDAVPADSGPETLLHYQSKAVMVMPVDDEIDGKMTSSNSPAGCLDSLIFGGGPEFLVRSETM